MARPSGRTNKILKLAKRVIKNVITAKKISKQNTTTVFGNQEQVIIRFGMYF